MLLHLLARGLFLKFLELDLLVERDLSVLNQTLTYDQLILPLLKLSVGVVVHLVHQLLAGLLLATALENLLDSIRNVVDGEGVHGLDPLWTVVFNQTISKLHLIHRLRHQRLLQ